MTGISDKPFTKALGMPVPGGKWRVSVSNEGEDRRQWGYKEVRDMLRQGLCTQLPGGVLRWYPRFRPGAREGDWDRWRGNPTTNVMADLPPQSLDEGVVVRFRMKSERHDSLGRKAEYDDRWCDEENSRNLRHLAGTGDFRIGLCQTGGRWDPGSWHCFQTRIFPHMHREAKDHIGENDRSNASYWYRREPGSPGCLMDDYSQEDDRDGFKKLKHRGELKFGMGPHAPFDEWFDVEVGARRRGREIHTYVKVHEDRVDLDPYEHDTDGFDAPFTHVDCLYLSFNNMRSYAGVYIDLGC